MFDKETTEYLCEIAFCYWANISRYPHHHDLFMHSWYDYEDMLKFYIMILEEAKKNYSDWVLSNIYYLIEEDVARTNDIFNTFIENRKVLLPDWNVTTIEVS